MEFTQGVAVGIPTAPKTSQIENQLKYVDNQIMTLSQLINHLEERTLISPQPTSEFHPGENSSLVDISDRKSVV